MVNKITDEATKIAQLEIMLRDHALKWYIKYKASTPAGYTKTLDQIKNDLIK